MKQSSSNIEGMCSKGKARIRLAPVCLSFLCLSFAPLREILLLRETRLSPSAFYLPP
jgi:hypothetical protein